MPSIWTVRKITAIAIKKICRVYIEMNFTELQKKSGNMLRLLISQKLLFSMFVFENVDSKIKFVIFHSFLYVLS